ncbi:MAG: hypothetical protein IT535_09510 [Bauldia sp.]|nr:hypothetical protein [Bauldia sp.]
MAARPLRALALLALVPLLAPPAFAQRDEQTYEQGRFSIDGIPASCGDNQVVVGARVDGPIGIRDNMQILIDSETFDPIPLAVKFFMFYYTCATITFDGDIAAIAPYVARVGKRVGWLSEVELRFACDTPALAAMGWTLAPDAERCVALRAAFAAAP